MLCRLSYSPVPQDGRSLAPAQGEFKTIGSAEFQAAVAAGLVRERSRRPTGRAGDAALSGRPLLGLDETEPTASQLLLPLASQKLRQLRNVCLLDEEAALGLSAAGAGAEHRRDTDFVTAVLQRPDRRQVAFLRDDELSAGPEPLLENSLCLPFLHCRLSLRIRIEGAAPREKFPRPPGRRRRSSASRGDPSTGWPR